MEYFFIFGKTPAISKAELASVLAKAAIKTELVSEKNDTLILSSQKKIDRPLFESLGGCVKFGEIIDREKKLEPAKLAVLIEDLSSKNKMVFGLSDYTGKYLKLYKLGIEIKKLIKENRPCRFVRAVGNALSSVSVAKNKLIEDGVELCVFFDGTDFLLGRSAAVQDFERWNRLDFGRPEFDAKIGMLPPKVAQMAVNLLPVKPESIWDPFCGFGTILQQAALSGVKKIIGSDINSETLKKCEKNIDWLKLKFNISSQIIIERLDASIATKKDLPFIPDAVITEPFLGKPLYGKEKESEILLMIKELKNLYLKAFDSLNNILAPGAFIVFIFPKIKTKERIFNVNISAELKNSFDRLNTWEYFRPGQHIERVITLWRKK
ncbi:MAG TPA: hypothetical protein VMX18_04405 [Candidatus Bipolaricaulota bacterium]|nr:hypothetical protein [Candidatus Bipolaricaulota bacterium]